MTRSSSRPLGKKHTYKISGTVSYGSVDSLGFASIAVWDVKTAQTLLDREGRYDLVEVAAKDGTSSAAAGERSIKPLLRPTCRSRTPRPQAKDDAARASTTA